MLSQNKVVHGEFTPQRSRKSNCFFFALWLFWTRGGYWACRRTRPPLTWGLHWSWSPDRKRWLHYEPIVRRENFLSATWHKLWFHGRIRRYDEPWQE